MVYISKYFLSIILFIRSIAVKVIIITTQPFDRIKTSIRIQSFQILQRFFCTCKCIGVFRSQCVFLSGELLVVPTISHSSCIPIKTANDISFIVLFKKIVHGLSSKPFPAKITLFLTEYLQNIRQHLHCHLISIFSVPGSANDKGLTSTSSMRKHGDGNKRIVPVFLRCHLLLC